MPMIPGHRALLDERAEQSIRVRESAGDRRLGRALDWALGRLGFASAYQPEARPVSEGLRADKWLGPGDLESEPEKEEQRT
jgi:hypothetical protein